MTQLHTFGSQTARDSMAFIGGGNMAAALISGLRRRGMGGDQLIVVDPSEVQRAQLQAQWQVRTLACADATLAQVGCVVWAIKPQHFQAALAPVVAHTVSALHVSVMAGIRSRDLSASLGTPRIVRSMPNTPGLIGQGVTGLYATTAVHADERTHVTAMMAAIGRCVWVDREEELDAVTAVSGSGPAYVFYLIEAMTEAAQSMGLSAHQAKTLVLGTLAGATELAEQSTDTPQVLRERVTSKGGTTQAAMAVLEGAGVKQIFCRALLAAQTRARELGDEFGQR